MMWPLFTNFQIPESNRTDLVRLWEDQLGHFTRDQIAEAIQTCLDQPRGGWPSIGVVKSYIPGYFTDEKIAMASWLRIMAAVNDANAIHYSPDGGSVPTMKSVSDAEMSVLSFIGGLDRLLTTMAEKPGQLDFVRQQYINAFTASELRFPIRRAIEHAIRTTPKSIEAPKERVERVVHEPPANFLPVCPICGRIPTRKEASWNGSVWDCGCPECGARYKVKEGDDGSAILIDNSTEGMID